MSLKKQKEKNHFISIIHENKRENHRVLINKRFFNLNNLNRWRLYLKLILQYVNYLHEIEQKDLTFFLQDVIKEVNNDSRAFKRKMGYLLGDWRRL